MPRKARIDVPGAVHHVIMRGITRSDIFYDNTDRERFLDRAGTILAEGRTICYSFSLLSNHVHLLLRTGTASLSDIMRRLLTGYAVSFNRRHKRSGHVFQNRYKSILCEEDPYLLELVRYIHLNPLRAKIVSDMESLDTYPYSGHSAIMGKFERLWMDSGYLLGLFHSNQKKARNLYRSFVTAGIKQGHREELIGGGLLRSNKGWLPVKEADHRRGDQRILGSSNFVQEVMKIAQETWERTYSHKMKGTDFVAVQKYVSRIFGIDPEELLLPGKYRTRSIARSVLCYFLVRELGMTATTVAAKLGIGQPAVSIAVVRGEAIVREKALRLP